MMKDNNTIIKLLGIASLFLAIAGVLFLGFAIFGDDATNTYLTAALGCICIGNLFNVIRGQMDKKG